MRKTIKEILIECGSSEIDADNLIKAARKEFDELLMDGNIQDAHDICETYFGLEPDYLDDLI